MWRALAAIALSASALLSQQAPPSASRDSSAQKKGSATLRGRVLSADTGTPLRKARVSLPSGVAGAAEIDPVFTDDQGRFEFVALPAGRYTVAAAKAGYTTTRFGARRLLDRAITLEVADGAVVDRVEIRMLKGAAVSGHVVDEFGDPLPAVAVSAGRLMRTDGRVRVVPAGAPAQTDDLGEYRISGLSAGNYIVSVAATTTAFIGSSVINMSGPGVVTLSTVSSAGGVVYSSGYIVGPLSPGRTWGRTYYPAALSLAQAQPIVVRAGDEITAIDFTPIPSTLPKLTLTVTDAAGNPASGMYSLISDTPFGPVSTSGSVQAGAANAMNVEPGEWVLIVIGPQGTAGTLLSVGSDELTVNLVLGKGGRMTGRVVFEGSTPPPNAQVELEAVLPGVDASLVAMRSAVAARMNRDGTFAMTDLVGTRELRLRSPRGWMLKSLTYQGRSLLDGPIAFKGGEELAGVEAVLTDRPAQLTGTVVDQDKASIRNYSVLVFPADRSLLRTPGRWARWVRPDQNGRFSVSDLLACDYLAIAVDDVDEAEWSNVEYLDRLRPRATRVTLGDGEAKAVVLELGGTP